MHNHSGNHMKADGQANIALNGILKDHLAAINQLFLHGLTLKNWGLKELNERAYKQSRP